ncbi:FMN-binding protein [Lactobacillus kalixensis]|uniref:FMN-binding domain-containing protein n=1 Tax=Lactobacillus kalixensis DSM 16043 TaxID=1423763 RepID=A0A0R1UGT2_9LACO|nr:FMN-binding protein [Lactobacillus kalixensis]KRL90339.1 hypothetical protein FC46_GL000243 [Lactobacillus kalixensis DSM 16043]
MIFKPGYYEAEIDNPARIKTEVKIEDKRIVDVKLYTLKDERPIEPDLAKEFKGQIIDAQSVNIDGVSAASILTKAVKSVVGKALADARI